MSDDADDLIVKVNIANELADIPQELRGASVEAAVKQFAVDKGASFEEEGVPEDALFPIRLWGRVFLNVRRSSWKLILSLSKLVIKALGKHYPSPSEVVSLFGETLGRVVVLPLDGVEIVVFGELLELGGYSLSIPIEILKRSPTLSRYDSTEIDEAIGVLCKNGIVEMKDNEYVKALRV